MKGACCKQLPILLLPHSLHYPVPKIGSIYRHRPHSPHMLICVCFSVNLIVNNYTVFKHYDKLVHLCSKM